MVKVTRFWYHLKNNTGVAWRTHKWLFIACIVFVLIGIAIGISVTIDPLMTHLRVSQNVLDSNIINSTTQDRGIGAFIASRLLDFGFGMALVFLMCLSKWTMWLAFPYLAFRGYWIVVNIFWVLDRFGFLPGILLIVIYTVWLSILLILFIIATIFLLRHCANIRKFGFRCNRTRRDFFHGLAMLGITVLFIAVVEWLVYWLILSRMIFPL